MTDLVPVTPGELVPYGISNAPVLKPKQMRKLARRFAGELARRNKPGQLIIWRSTCVRAYVYRGRWVGDCPVEGCKNAEYLTVEPLYANRYSKESRWDRKDYFICSNRQCGTVTQSIVFPHDADDIENVLNLRPLAMTRNWYPAGHITAVQHGVEDGQTVAELIQENIDHGVM
jgi:hypothetical protein